MRARSFVILAHMKIRVKSILVSRPILGTGSEKAFLGAEVEFSNGLEMEVREDLLPEELEYIRDGLNDATERIRQRVLDAIRSAGEQET